MIPTLTILYEDEHLIVCVKPAGIPCQSDRSGSYDLCNMLRNHLAKTSKGQIPYIGLLHRLDRPVGGVMVFAKTKEAAATLSRTIKLHSEQPDNKKFVFEKKYTAVLAERTTKTSQEATNAQNEKAEKKRTNEKISSGTLKDYIKKNAKGYGTLEDYIKKNAKGYGTLEDYIKKNAKDNCSVIASKGDKDAKYACLEYQITDKILIPCEPIVSMKNQDSEDTLNWKQNQNSENYFASDSQQHTIHNFYCLQKAEINLKTGRHHQIRLQCATHLSGLWADSKYHPLFQGNFDYNEFEENAKIWYENQYQEKMPKIVSRNVALFSHSLTFSHPVTKKVMTFEAAPEGSVFGLFR